MRTITLDTSAQANPGLPARILNFLRERTIINHGAADRFESADRRQHLCSKQDAPAGSNSQPALRIVSAIKRIDELEEKDERGNQPSLTEVIGPQRGHNRDEIQIFADQLLVECGDYTRCELDIGIEQKKEPRGDELSPLF